MPNYLATLIPKRSSTSCDVIVETVKHWSLKNALQLESLHLLRLNPRDLDVQHKAAKDVSAALDSAENESLEALQLLFCVLDNFADQSKDLMADLRGNFDDYNAIVVPLCGLAEEKEQESVGWLGKAVTCMKERSSNALQPFRLLVLDFDSTLIEQETIDLVADQLSPSLKEEIKRVTERAMRGELDFESSLRLRVSNFKGLDTLNTWNYVRSKVSIRPGFCGLLRACKSICNIDIAVLSGGFVEMINEVASKIGCIDFTLSNMLETVIGDNGRIVFTGDLNGQVIGPAEKAAFVKKFLFEAKLAASQSIIIGDGFNDVPMLSLSPFGIALNAKPRVKELAPMKIDAENAACIWFLIDPFNKHKLFSRITL